MSINATNWWEWTVKSVAINNNYYQKRFGYSRQDSFVVLLSVVSTVVKYTHAISSINNNYNAIEEHKMIMLWKTYFILRIVFDWGGFKNVCVIII